MKNLSFVVWLIGFPFTQGLVNALSTTPHQDTATDAILCLLLYFGVAALIYERGGKTCKNI
jgi:hypothetical protein